jgi:flagellar biosynthesis protein FliP
LRKKTHFGTQGLNQRLEALKKLVWLGVSTNPPNQNLIHEFLINMAFIMAYPNYKKGLKMALSPLGVNEV